MAATELARAFEVDVRTIYRDIQALCELNVPIISQPGPEGGYSLSDKYYVPSISFSIEEIFSLLLSKQVIKKVRLPGYTQYINSAFLKIENAVSPELMKELEKTESRIVFDKTNKHIQKEDLKYFQVIKDGIKENKKIIIDIATEDGLAIVRRTVEPYGLIYVNEVWQLIFNDEKDGLVDVPINWIKEAVLLDKAFEISPDFDIDKYYCQHFCGLPCPRKHNQTNPEKTKIKILREKYYTIRDFLFFHDNSDIIEENDEYIIVTTVALESSYYVQIAEKFPDCVEILAPQWLREVIFKEAEKICNKYKKC